MTDRIATCQEANYDAVNGTCSLVEWVPRSDLTWLPKLSAGPGAAIGAAIFAGMGVAYLLRKARSAG